MMGPILRQPPRDGTPLKSAAAVPVLFLVLCIQASFAATEDLGGGFLHHGVATSASNHRGTVATVDGQGRNVVLLWLFDNRGGYALLWLDAETGKAQEFPMPFPPGGDCPYASILSSRNKFYTHFNSHFAEFDPGKRAFTFFKKTLPQMAMSMTEDDAGRIWLASYPQSGVVSFDPNTAELKDYGHVHKENWRQYPRSIAADDQGWIYFGIGNTLSHLIALDPKTGTARAMISEAERARGTGYVYRGTDGKVYGQAVSGAKGGWHELYGGQAKKLAERPTASAKPFIASSQGLFHRQFPDGKVLRTCDLISRTFTVDDPKTGKSVTHSFDYESLGAHLMGVAASPDGTICGGTAFPMRFFSYDPKTDQWINRDCYGQWNTVARQGERFLVGGYSSGFLLDWDPSRPWVATSPGKAESNPLFLTECHPTIGRPTALYAHPDGKTLVLAGTPGYGYTGGGLMFWDRTSGSRTLLEHTDVLPEHSTASLAALPEGKLLGGTTTSAGTGGEKKAEQAELYIMNIASKLVDWHEAVLPGAQHYTDLCQAPAGLIYGFADYGLFFVFDPASRQIVHQFDARPQFGSTASGQGPRVFVTGTDETIYVLFAKGIAKVEPKTFEIKMLAESPVRISPGGDILDGRIYFGSGSHLYSYGVGK